MVTRPHKNISRLNLPDPTNDSLSTVHLNENMVCGGFPLLPVSSNIAWGIIWFNNIRGFIVSGLGGIFLDCLLSDFTLRYEAEIYEMGHE